MSIARSKPKALRDADSNHWLKKTSFSKFDPLTRGKIGELFGSGTNLSPDDILAGKAKGPMHFVAIASGQHTNI